MLLPLQPVAAISAGRYGLVQGMASPDLKAPGFGWLRDSTFAMLKSAELKSGGKAARLYTEAEGTRTGLVVGDGYHLIESLFGREMNLISN